MRREKFLLLITIFALAFFLACAASLYVGEADLSFLDILRAIFLKSQNEYANTVIWHIRLPRLLTGVFAGVGLSLAGCAMQTLFRNPLADPSLTGVSSGAALGGALFICVFQVSGIAMQLCAMLVGFLASLFIWKAGRFCGKINAYAMLLAGIAVNAFCAAIIGFLMYSSKEEGVRGFLFWSLGSLEFANWQLINCAGAVTLLTFIVLMRFSRELNMMFLGSESAFYAGANLKRIQAIAMICSVILTAEAVSICGIVGFVGLIVPHITRLLASSDNRYLIPLSAILGATILTVCDIISRVVSPELNIPIGIMTALFGAPFFIFLMFSKTKMKA